jgi:hypothetical protein
MILDLLQKKGLIPLPPLGTPSRPPDYPPPVPLNKGEARGINVYLLGEARGINVYLTEEAREITVYLTGEARGINIYSWGALKNFARGLFQ